MNFVPSFLFLAAILASAVSFDAQDRTMCPAPVRFLGHGSMTVVKEDDMEYRYQATKPDTPGVDVLVFIDESVIGKCSAFLAPADDGSFVEHRCENDGHVIKRIYETPDDLPVSLLQRFEKLRERTVGCSVAKK